MQYREFVGQVQNRAHLASEGDAVAAIRATLTTLGERLAGREPQHLAAQLPHEIGRYLEAEGDEGVPARLSLDQFFARIAARERIDLPDAVHHARVVAEVLSEAVSPGEIQDVLAQLPSDYCALFAGSTGRMPRARGRRRGQQG